MEPIPTVVVNTAVPDEVLAQTVAALSSWQRDLAGMIFDERGKFVARSLTTLGAVMRGLGWFIPVQSPATGIAWRNVPNDVKERAGEVLTATPRP